MRIAVSIPTEAAGSSLSAAIDLGPQGRLVGIEMSTTWVAAAISLQVSLDGTTWMDLYQDGGTQVSLTVDASRIVALRQDMRSILGRFRYLKLRSGLTAAHVDQTATRTLYVLADQER